MSSYLCGLGQKSSDMQDKPEPANPSFVCLRLTTIRVTSEIATNCLTCQVLRNTSARTVILIFSSPSSYSSSSNIIPGKRPMEGLAHTYTVIRNSQMLKRRFAKCNIICILSSNNKTL